MQPHKLNSVFDTSERRKKIAIVGDVFGTFPCNTLFSAERLGAGRFSY